MAIINDKAFYGTERKYIVEIVSPGFDMVRDDFEIELKRGNISKVFHKEDLVVETETATVNNEEVETTNYYLCFDTKDFGKGVITAIITAHVPDADFDDGIRDEVDKFDLLNVMW